MNAEVVDVRDAGLAGGRLCVGRKSGEEEMCVARKVLI